MRSHMGRGPRGSLWLSQLVAARERRTMRLSCLPCSSTYAASREVDAVCRQRATSPGTKAGGRSPARPPLPACARVALAASVSITQGTLDCSMKVQSLASSSTRPDLGGSAAWGSALAAVLAARGLRMLIPRPSLVTPKSAAVVVVVVVVQQAAAHLPLPWRRLLPQLDLMQVQVQRRTRGSDCSQPLQLRRALVTLPQQLHL
mmetsp:Transcript_2658/g.5885  ORF Transcript_2658/g.5885 Transcript_2658/m.5885 type:complete len:203 (+) Transcript_2658:644-1252(+)